MIYNLLFCCPQLRIDFREFGNHGGFLDQHAENLSFAVYMCYKMVKIWV